MLPLQRHPIRSRARTQAQASAPTPPLRARRPIAPPPRALLDGAADAARRAASAASAAAAAAALVLLASTPAPATAEELTLRFKASADPQIRAAQQQLVEAWALTSALFVDGEAIAKPEWHDGLSKALDASFSETSAEGVRRLEDELLARLNDPFTHVLRGKAAERLAAEEEGRVVSNGLALLPSSSSSSSGGEEQQQQWAVAYVAPGGPAEAAGVRVGDAVLSVDGAPPPQPSPLSSDKGERERFLARVSREPVALRLSRQKTAASNAVIIDARLSPAPVDVESVQWGVLRVPRSGADADGAGDDNKAAASFPVAYLRIAQFSQRTPEAVVAAMDGLFGDGGANKTAVKPRALLVDLRDDAGGVVEAGVEVARQLLRPGDALAVVTSRAGGATAIETTSERVVLTPPPDADSSSSSSQAPALYAAGGPASKRLPMAVLTTHNTASTAELLAGALRDGGPDAVIVGEKTFGKGRTQRVMALQNGATEEDDGAGGDAGGKGATLLVSTMRFATPSGAPIDGVGLEPGVACSAPASGFEVFTGGGAVGEEGAEAEMRALFEGDACVRRAAEVLAAKSGF